MAISVPPYRYENASKTLSFDAFSESHIGKLRESIRDTLADNVTRMSRAFPTFQVSFIEEDAPQWGFYDDIYGYDSVKSIDIYKSRKDAADTAVVQITNFKGTLDNKNFLDRYHADTAKEHYDETIIDGQERQDEINKMFIRPGLRVKIQLGYSSHSDNLDNTFTGIVTEVQHGDIITFVAQGYGVELLHNVGLSFWEEAKRVVYANAKQLLASLITSKYARHLGRRGINNPTKEAAEGDKNRYLTSNPIDDNIFMVDGGFIKYWIDDYKWIKQFKVYHTTAWDAIQDVSRRFPGHIACVVPFDDRGTVFFGNPDQPYFFTATENKKTRRLFEININNAKKAADDGEPSSSALDLNAKVFRSYHIKDSEHHIIANNIKINMDNFYNRIVIEYKPSLRKKMKSRFEPLSADDSIPKKYIKEKVVFEQNCETAASAKDYALSNLLLSTKELYDGELIMLGDPSIKPYDTIIMADGYNRMYGPIEVREVIHRFNREEGFTTTVVPDLVVHINNPFKIAALVANSFKLNAMALASQASLNVPYPVTLGIQNFSKVIDRKLGNNVVSSLYGISGWQGDKTREPIGISPLIYNDKPYIAGFEGMKSEDWWVRKLEGWTKAWGEVKLGTRTIVNVTKEILRGR